MGPNSKLIKEMIFSLFSIICVVCVSLTFAQSPTPAKPNIPKNYKTPIKIELPINGIKRNLTGTYHDDQINSQSLMELNTHFFSYSLSDDLYSFKTSGFLSINGICRPSSRVYSNFFAWIAVPTVKFAGKEQVGGVTCNLWQLSNANGLIVQACATDDSVLRLDVYQGTKSTLFFGQFVPTKDQIKVPQACHEPGKVCSSGSVEIVDMYRLHNIHDTNLANRNFASLPGDMAYFCLALLDNSFLAGNDSLVSHFQINTNTTWGRYALCNHNVCDGGVPNTVGHEAAMGLARHGDGQCAVNAGVGEWYSLSEGGQCQAGQSPSSGACVWQLKQRVKSVATSCLVQQGVRKACAVDAQQGGFPFKRATRVVANAFAGTCPDTPPIHTPSPPTMMPAALSAQRASLPSSSSHHLAVDELMQSLNNVFNSL